MIEVPEGRVKRYNVLSKIKIKPTAQDDLSEYTCEARHEALPRDMLLKATVQLSVLCEYFLPGSTGIVIVISDITLSALQIHRESRTSKATRSGRPFDADRPSSSYADPAGAILPPS